MPKSPKPNRRPAARSRASAPHQPFAPAETRARHDGWTRERQTGFIRALAESGCVEEACAAVGMSRQSAYRLRARIDAQGFRVAWDKALDYAIRRLSDACFARALHGEVRPIFYKGEQIGERVVHDNKLAMFMLRYRDPLRYAASLDQMVYSGHVESAAIDLNAAIHRVADEAEELAGFEADRADPQPYATRPTAAVRADAEAAAIIASDAPVYGSHERRTRIREARIARDMRAAGYSNMDEWAAARTAAHEAQVKADLEAARSLFGRDTPAEPAANGADPEPSEGDSGQDVASPLSPSRQDGSPVPHATVAIHAPTPAGGTPRAQRSGRGIAPSIRSLGG